MDLCKSEGFFGPVSVSFSRNLLVFAPEAAQNEATHTTQVSPSRIFRHPRSHKSSLHKNSALLSAGFPFPSFALPLSPFKAKPNNFSRTLLAAPDTFWGCRTDTCLGDGNIPRVRLQPLDTTSKALAKQPLKKPKTPKNSKRCCLANLPVCF